MNDIFFKSLRKVIELLHWTFVNPICLLISNHTDYFDYKRLLNLSFACNPFELRENSFYGHRRVVKRLGGGSFGSRIEHGVFFSEGVGDMELCFAPIKRFLYHLRRVYTYSERRKKFVEKFMSEKGIKLSIFAIGPYIKYADYFYNMPRLLKIKQKLGRVLLVYPQHSIEQTAASFDASSLIRAIENQKESFDTVMVSLYWADIIRGVANVYERAGYLCVSSGRREDPNFLSRQKDVLWLADLVLTNTIGTHVGYAIAMNRPCRVFAQAVEFNSKVVNGKRKEYEAEIQAQRGHADVVKRLAPYFESSSMEITDIQRKIIEEYWGLL